MEKQNQNKELNYKLNSNTRTPESIVYPINNGLTPYGSLATKTLSFNSSYKTNEKTPSNNLQVSSMPNNLYK